MLILRRIDSICYVFPRYKTTYAFSRLRDICTRTHLQYRNIYSYDTWYMYEYTYKIAVFSTNRNAKRQSCSLYIEIRHILREKKKRKKIQLIIVTRFVSTRFISMDKKR